MRSFGVLGVVAVCAAMSACGLVTGVDQYSEGCVDGCADATADASWKDARPGTGADAAGRDVTAGGDARDDGATAAGDGGGDDTSETGDDGAIVATDALACGVECVEAGLDAADGGALDAGNDSGADAAATGDGAVETGADGGGDASGVDAGTCGPTNTVQSCSGCGLACDTTTGVPSCDGTRCSYVCNQGLLDCNAATAPDVDGCETSGTTTSSCGSCGKVCSSAPANAQPACVSGACSFACDTGFTACNAACVDEQTDGSNCGGCGAAHACAGGTTCQGGVCAAPACPKGGCNASGGTCSASGQACFCTSNNQCASGVCSKITGQNGMSCGSNCTLTAAAVDGFDCVLQANGIPASCALAFGYAPSNFTATSYTPPASDTTDCNATYSSTSGTFTTGACAGQAPGIHHGVAQAGGPSVDILVFNNLTIAGGSTLALTGSNAVILAVYGNATITGNINANGASGATNSTTAGASGPGGNYSCGSSAGSSPPNSNNNNGGGGGGATGAGGHGAADASGNAGGNAGVSRAHASIVPLYGGCPGGNGGSCGHTQSGGGGGGAVQISAAGALAVSGMISAAGGAGGPGTSGEGCGSTGFGGGGGGGSGGAVLLEGTSAPIAGTVTGGAGGGAGGNSTGGSGGTSGTPTGGNGTTDTSNATKGGAGGGGGYGYLKINTGLTATAYACVTTLSPAPVCNGAHTACLCVADPDCSSGKCSNVNSQCTGTCIGTTTAGTYDTVDCQLLASP